MFVRLFAFTLLLTMTASAQVIDTMPNYPLWERYVIRDDTPEQKKAKAQFCQEFGHDTSDVGFVTLVHCPEYTVDLADRTIRVIPHCNSTWASCRRCGADLRIPGAPNDTIVVRMFSDPEVIARRKHLLEQMERRLEPDTSRRYILDMSVHKVLSPDTSFRAMDSVDLRSRRSMWSKRIIDTITSTTIWVYPNKEDSIKVLWKKIRSLQRQIKKYKQRAAIDTTTMGMVTFTPMSARASDKGVAYKYPAPLGWWYMVRRNY